MVHASHPYSRLALAGAGVLLAASLALPAQAQDVIEPEGDAAERQSATRPARASMDEIVVTARRSDERLQDTPVAVTAVSADALEQRGIGGLANLDTMVPNATFYARGGSSNAAAVYLRGVGQADDLFMFDSGVGIYVDDVYIARVQASMFDLLDVERVEVLRGPQGSLYGKNTSGGAVKLVSRRPDLDGVSGHVSMAAGSHDLFSSRMTLNVPLVQDRVGLRANLLRIDRGGFVDNVNDGRELQTRDFLGGRISLLALPTDDLSVWVSYDNMHDNSIPAAPTPIDDFDFPSIGSFPALPPRESASVAPLYYDQRNWGVNSTIEWNLSGFQLKSISAYRRLTFSNSLDYLGTPVPLIHAQQYQMSDQLSQELQFNFDIGDRTQVVSGLYFMNEGSETDYEIPNIIVIPDGSGDAFGLPNTSLYGAKLDTRSYALFAHVVHGLSDKLSLSAGLRYSYDKKEYQAALANDAFPTANFDYDLADSWGRWLPKLGLEYTLEDGSLVYLSYATGFRSGGFNPRATSGFFAQGYDPETNATYEVGYKTMLLDSTLSFNSALFYNRFKNYQTTIRVLDPDTNLFSGLFANTGKYDSYGAETELLWRPLPDFRLGGQLAYFNSGFDSFETGLFGNLEDKDLPNAPKWSGAVFASYGFDVESYGYFEFSVDAAYRSETYTTLGNDADFRRDAYVLLNGRISFFDRGGAWSAYIAGRNLTNKTILLDGNDLFSSYYVRSKYFQEPRTYTVGVRYQFGNNP